MKKTIKNKIPIFILIVLSVLGIADSAYLTYKHYSGDALTCTVLEGCNEVLSSAYAVVLGVPVSILGIIFYGAVLLLSFLYFDTRNKKILLILFLISILGFLASLWFLYLQFFVIQALCQYCIFSAILSMSILISVSFEVGWHNNFDEN